MSHVAEVKCEIKDLAALKKAAENLGMELIEGQKQYRWWGHSVGDYPLPQNFTAKDLGKCEHAIRLKNDHSSYEIGVCTRRDGKPGFTLLYDFYGQAKLVNAIGKDACKLTQQYNVEVAKKNVPFGYSIKTTTLKNGNIVLTAVKY
jgi:hypothetical protein